MPTGPPATATPLRCAANGWRSRLSDPSVKRSDSSTSLILRAVSASGLCAALSAINVCSSCATVIRFAPHEGTAIPARSKKTTSTHRIAQPRIRITLSRRKQAYRSPALAAAAVLCLCGSLAHSLDDYEPGCPAPRGCNKQPSSVGGSLDSETRESTTFAQPPCRPLRPIPHNRVILRIRAPGAPRSGVSGRGSAVAFDLAAVRANLGAPCPDSGAWESTTREQHPLVLNSSFPQCRVILRTRAPGAPRSGVSGSKDLLLLLTSLRSARTWVPHVPILGRGKPQTSPSQANHPTAICVSNNRRIACSNVSG